MPPNRISTDILQHCLEFAQGVVIEGLEGVFGCQPCVTLQDQFTNCSQRESDGRSRQRKLDIGSDNKQMHLSLISWFNAGSKTMTSKGPDKLGNLASESVGSISGNRRAHASLGFMNVAFRNKGNTTSVGRQLLLLHKGHGCLVLCNKGVVRLQL